MKKDLTVILFICALTLIFWQGAIFNFFAQDDFIFIKHFSQNNLLTDIVNTFGKPEVTHWRPIHNLYFLIAGNLFGKNYVFYHLLILLLHIAASFLIYKIVVLFSKNFWVAVLSALVYAIHPAHFVALYWISGSAINIGVFFLLLSFYQFLLGMRVVSIPLYILALLASEAIVASVPLFVLSTFLNTKHKSEGKFLILIIIATVVFLIIKFLNISPASFEIYQLEISSAVFFALYYYVLRILGFAETSGDLIPSIILAAFLIFVFWRALAYIKKHREKLILPLSSFIGLFPFVLLPTHLSPHYMVLPIFGFCQIFGLGLCRFPKTLMIVGFLIFAAISFLNIQLTGENNWVVKRSELAKKYLVDLEDKNLPSGSTITISAKETYIALGQGNAVDFWFSGKNYKSVFSF